MNYEVLELMLLSMDESAITRLKLTTNNINDAVNVVTNNHSYWYTKLSELLGFVPDINSNDAKEIYLKMHNRQELELAAIDLGYVNIVKGFIANGWDPSIKRSYAIRRAIEQNQTEIVKLLLTDARVTVDNYSFFKAARNNNVELVKVLLNRREIKPNVNENAALIIAIKNGNAEMVKVLLKDDRIDPSDDSNRAIHTADVYKKSDIIGLLLDDPRVKNTLSQEQIMYYENKLI